jgi:hypothetical protein
LGRALNLYSIDPNSGAATATGATGIRANLGVAATAGLPAGSSTLDFTL